MKMPVGLAVGAVTMMMTQGLTYCALRCALFLADPRSWRRDRGDLGQFLPAQVGLTTGTGCTSTILLYFL